MHPEQYSNTLSRPQVAQLHKSLVYVTTLAVETRSDSSQFPDTWLFKHRWGKGKKDSPNVLPNGARITFLTVGGRTSAVVPSVQKKTGPVAGDFKDEGDCTIKGEVEKEKTAGEEKATGRSKAAKTNVKAKAKAKAKPTRKRVKAAETEESASDLDTETELESEFESAATPEPSKKRKSAPRNTAINAASTALTNGASKRRNTAVTRAATAKRATV